MDANVAEWAAAYAASKLAGMGARWAHTLGVVGVAVEVADGVRAVDRDLLLAAAYLHDIGYAPGVAVTGFHPLDGGRHVRSLGHERLACLVARHSCAAMEAALRGLSGELDEFPVEDSATSRALTYCDVTTGPAGVRVSVDERVADVARRYGENHVVTRSMRATLPELREIVAGVEHALAEDARIRR